MIYLLTDIHILHVNMIILHVDINKSQVRIITGILHVDIIHLERSGQKYATYLNLTCRWQRYTTIHCRTFMSKIWKYLAVVLVLMSCSPYIWHHNEWSGWLDQYRCHQNQYDWNSKFNSSLKTVWNVQLLYRLNFLNKMQTDTSY